MSDLIERLDNAGPDDDNLFDLCMESFGEIERLTTECERQVNAKMVLGRSVVRLTAEGARKGAEMADRLGDLLLEREKTRTLTAKNERLQARVDALEGMREALKIERQAAHSYDQVHARDFTLAQRKTDEALAATEQEGEI